MASYPLKASYWLYSGFIKKNKKKIFGRIKGYEINTTKSQKNKIAKTHFGTKADHFEYISYFGPSDSKSIIFIEKKEKGMTIHLFSQKKPSFKKHMLCLENRVISNPKGFTRLIPSTLYPIEFLNIYIKGFELNRVLRRKRFGNYLVQSIALYISPILVIYFNNILAWEIPDFDVTKSIVLLIIYTILFIYNAVKIARGKHAIQF